MTAIILLFIDVLWIVFAAYIYHVWTVCGFVQKEGSAMFGLGLEAALAGFGGWTPAKRRSSLGILLFSQSVFPVVKDRCETWTIKKTKCQRICFPIVVLEKTLKSLLDSKKVKPVNPKVNKPWIFIGRIDAKDEALILGHLMWRANSLEKILMLGNIEGRRTSGQQRMRWMK